MSEPKLSGTQRFYDHEADSYDESRYESTSGRYADAFHRTVLRKGLVFDPRHENRVIELGCGTGRLLTDFSQTGFRVFGMDFSGGMLGKASERLTRSGQGEVCLLQGDITRLPFPDGYFTAAYSILVLNLLEDLSVCLAEAARVIQPGGRFVFNLPNQSSIFWPFALYINVRKRTRTRNAVGYRPSHWYSRSEVCAALEKAGFSLVSIFGQYPVYFSEPGDELKPASWLERSVSKSLYYVVERRRD